MREAAIALSIFLGLAFVAWVLEAASWLLLLYGGLFLILGGLAFGIPCAVAYHWYLYAALQPRGALDKRWLWNPTTQHGKLLPAERPRVMAWFYAGAAGWGASVLGCVFAGAAALMMR